jgi:hypothetical protein
MMHLDDIEALEATVGPPVWIAPKEIRGIDEIGLKRANEEQWFSVANSSTRDIELPDLTVVLFLLRALRARTSFLEQGSEVPEQLDVSSSLLLEGVLHMISVWGSSFAATMFVGEKDIVSAVEKDPEKSLDLMRSKYMEADPFVKDILRDFILDVLRYGPAWEPTVGRYCSSLRDDQIAFLQHLSDGGYVTIDNADGRYFVDGRRRL